jgi:hypothetical protein
VSEVEGLAFACLVGRKPASSCEIGHLVCGLEAPLGLICGKFVAFRSGWRAPQLTRCSGENSIIGALGHCRVYPTSARQSVMRTSAELIILSNVVSLILLEHHEVLGASRRERSFGVCERESIAVLIDCEEHVRAQDANDAFAQLQRSVERLSDLTRTEPSAFDALKIVDPKLKVGMLHNAVGRNPPPSPKRRRERASGQK